LDALLPIENVRRERNACTLKRRRWVNAETNGLSCFNLKDLRKLPDDAERIPIYFTDQDAAVSMEMGKIRISVQILPEEDWEGPERARKDFKRYEPESSEYAVVKGCSHVALISLEHGSKVTISTSMASEAATAVHQGDAT
jgi:hypothetical protein